MGALTDLLKSERGLFALALVIASTVLTALGHMSIDAWKDFSLYVFGIYVTGKTVTGAVGIMSTSKQTSAASTATVPLPTPDPAPAVESSKA